MVPSSDSPSPIQVIHSEDLEYLSWSSSPDFCCKINTCIVEIEILVQLTESTRGDTIQLLKITSFLSLNKQYIIEELANAEKQKEYFKIPLNL